MPQRLVDLLRIRWCQPANTLENERFVHRVHPTFHRRWHVESGSCPIRKDELPGKRRGRPTGERNDKDILRYVRSIDNDGGADFHA